METTFFICRDCESEFEMLLMADIEYACLYCNSAEVRERKNAKINCTTCCDGCDQKSTCSTWND
jgi:DNA-directed RNA polymerase subunit RPC12/RpoP